MRQTLSLFPPNLSFINITIILHFSMSRRLSKLLFEVSNFVSKSLSVFAKIFPVLSRTIKLSVSMERSFVMS